MAKWEGDQVIPAEWLDLWRATITDKSPKNITRKRYPYRVPTMQTHAGHPSVKQKAQRARFLIAKEDFASVDWPARQRWYAAAPEYGSFLWYYNYFIMSSLLGNADPEHGGFGVIKTIQFKTISMPAGTGEGQVAITAVDITKTVVMLFGSSVTWFEAELWATGVPVYPYVSSLAAELVKCKWSLDNWDGNVTLAAAIGIIVIEYI